MSKKQNKKPWESRDIWALNAPDHAISRFFSKIEKTPECHLFQTASANGYGSFSIVHGLTMNAHRFALLLDTRTPPPPKMYACHKCRNKNCVNPKHLYWGTAKQNAADVKRDGTANPVHSLKHFRAKLTPAKARKIANQYMADKKSLTAIAQQNGVSESTVTNIIIRKTWARHTTDIALNLRVHSSKYISRGGKHPLALISDKKAQRIISMLELGKSIRETADLAGVHYACAKDIKNLKTWTHLPRSVVLLRKKQSPVAPVRRGIARHVFRDYHTKGKSIPEIAAQRNLTKYVVKSICSQKKNAKDTADLAVGHDIGHFNRKTNTSKRPKLCVVCSSEFSHGKSSKKTCSHECLCTFRKNLVTQTHAQGKIWQYV